ncbi:S-adenosyl-L-methionine-dependent methyltransferase [Phakopsora pachyrhizi]|uniref:Leucine carboxyl methyltransferase 1 n=1 Tax=Phakopsora pachyrhizi TaxID=170000 RepID=A0AAV0BP17_PHAPC|nr:S-adenosyl-L-methionine-dependent methyltransferase [Phakopsora pachyrhizi]
MSQSGKTTTEQSQSHPLPNNPFENRNRLSRSRFKKSIDPDQAVRETDNDATMARLSAISKGYIKDRFSELLVRTDESDYSRPPWVNIGTHHRTYLIDMLVESFLINNSKISSPSSSTTTTTTTSSSSSCQPSVQVLSLGSGSDSRYWRLRDKFQSGWPVKIWIETDFLENTQKKIRRIVNNPLLRSMCGDQIRLGTGAQSENQRRGAEEDLTTDLYSTSYAMISSDLRQPDRLIGKLRSNKLIDSNLPTLIIAELVFVYMLPQQTEDCLRKLSDEFGKDDGGDLMVITYEALNLGDSFSKVMTENLSSRGLTLLGFDNNSTIESQIQRFKSLNFDQIVSQDMKKIRTISDWNIDWRSELERIRRLEFLDEVEELELVLKHYCLTWALRSERENKKGLMDHKFNFHLPYQ